MTTEQLRTERAKALAAYDIYRIHVIFDGLECSTDRRAALYQWYVGCLELDEEAIMNPPEEVAWFM